jgi:hypothetical protein
MPTRWLLNGPIAIFSVLGLALVGGMLGLFVDAMLLAITPRYWHAGWAQHAGWLAFFILAVVQLVRGKLEANWWVEQSASGQADDASDDAHNARGTPVHRLAGAMLGAFGGAILGVILGGALLMIWFSLSLSPWPPADWADSLSWDAADDRPRGDSRDGGLRMTTSHPVAMAMFCVPIALLSLGGSIFGFFGSVTVGSARRMLPRPGARSTPLSDASASAADLPRLAPAPRRVPWSIWRQAVRDQLAGHLIGALFFSAGAVCLAVLGVIAWNQRSPLSAASAVGFSLLLVATGGAFFYFATRSTRTTLRALRHGRLAHATIVQCRENYDGASNRPCRWTDFPAAFDTLEGCWDEPLPISSSGARRISIAATVFALAVFGFMGAIGVFLSGAAVYVIAVEGKSSGWYMAAFMVLWWTVIVAIARLFLQQARPFARGEKWNPKSLGVQPIVECRARLALPDGGEVEFETKIDLTSRLAAGSADPRDVAVYDPAEPQRAILLSTFHPPLSITRAGHWEQAVGLSYGGDG